MNPEASGHQRAKHHPSLEEHKAAALAELQGLFAQINTALADGRHGVAKNLHPIAYDRFLALEEKGHLSPEDASMFRKKLDGLTPLFYEEAA